MGSVRGSQLVRQRFSDAARRYSDLADIQTAIARDLVAKAHVASGKHVLDVGAGDGVIAQALAGSGPFAYRQ